MESNCKLIVDMLMNATNCPWKMLTVFESVSSLFRSVNHVSLDWCDRSKNLTADEVFRVNRSGTGFMLNYIYC